jgi:hypothetical protein
MNQKIFPKIKRITKNSPSFKSGSLNKIKEKRGINVNIINFLKQIKKEALIEIKK